MGLFDNALIYTLLWLRIIGRVQFSASAYPGVRTTSQVSEAAEVAASGSTPLPSHAAAATAAHVWNQSLLWWMATSRIIKCRAYWVSLRQSPFAPRQAVHQGKYLRRPWLLRQNCLLDGLELVSQSLVHLLGQRETFLNSKPHNSSRKIKFQRSIPLYYQLCSTACLFKNIYTAVHVHFFFVIIGKGYSLSRRAARVIHHKISYY